MKNDRRTKEDLTKRRDEINAQLNRTESDLRIELEQDPEEQAIQVEQNDVAIAMENNLRNELSEIEEKLAVMEEE